MADISPDERRRREEEMERLMMEQEEELLQQQQQEEEEGEQQPPINQEAAAANNNNGHLPPPLPPPPAPPVKPGLFSYRPLSFLAFFVLLYYAFRSRRQYYLALVYLSSSKYAYVIIGNAVLAMAVSIFDITVDFFVSGLRSHEAEGMQDFFRWNVTETCLALTMFRSELTVGVAVQFVMVILAKCLHHVAAQREQHLRLTEETVHESYPYLKSQHVRVVAFLTVLQFLDLLTLEHMANALVKEFPSVRILFAFEAAIMLVSAWSHILLWYMHLVDSIISLGHEKHWGFASRLLHPWKEYKATLIFAVELQAQVVKFLFYMTFFFIVMSYYGMPINLFREVYMSFIALKERLAAFLKYRHLMASMNRFQSATEDELEDSGRTCIICRDEMHVGDCKRLPGCGHLFHKSCLREWLVQQQSCPTCRADISAMEAQEAARGQAAEAATGRLQDEALDAILEDDDDDEVFEHTSTAPKSPPTALYRALKVGQVYSPDDLAIVQRAVSPNVLVLGQESTARIIDGMVRPVIRVPDGFMRAEDLEKVADFPAQAI